MNVGGAIVFVFVVVPLVVGAVSLVVYGLAAAFRREPKPEPKPGAPRWDPWS